MMNRDLHRKIYKPEYYWSHKYNGNMTFMKKKYF